MVGRAGGRFRVVCMGVVVTVSCRRVMVRAIVVFTTAEATWSRQRVVMWVVMRVRVKVW